MAPVQKLGNIDLKKRTSQKFAFGFFTLLSYLVVAILFVILGFIIIKGGSVISWDFLTKAPEDGNDERRNLPGDRRNLLPDRRKQYHQFPDRDHERHLHE